MGLYLVWQEGTTDRKNCSGVVLNSLGTAMMNVNTFILQLGFRIIDQILITFSDLFTGETRASTEECLIKYTKYIWLTSKILAVFDSFKTEILYKCSLRTKILLKLIKMCLSNSYLHSKVYVKRICLMLPYLEWFETTPLLFNFAFERS
jgi:hypothetical protein